MTEHIPFLPTTDEYKKYYIAPTKSFVQGTKQGTTTKSRRNKILTKRQAARHKNKPTRRRRRGKLAKKTRSKGARKRKPKQRKPPKAKRNKRPTRKPSRKPRNFFML